MMSRLILPAVLAIALAAANAWAQEAASLSALAKMPIKEVTVFKDGHALVLHAGKMPVDAAGNVLMDYLPTPVLGTFWPYVSEKGATLQAVVAGKRRVLLERTALNLNELIEANIGHEVIVSEVTEKEKPDRIYPATIVGIPARSGAELAATSPPNSPEMLPQKGTLVLLKTDDGVRAVRMDLIRDVTVKGEMKAKVAQEEFRNLLTLKIGWSAKPQANADVGMMYLQRGIRWIPSYKVAIDGKGGAVLKLQATLVNELADLDDVTAHLVVGVPTFKFQDMADPIGLQEQVAQLSQYFRPDSRMMNLSNAMMSQAAGSVSNRPMPEAAPTMDLGPEVRGSSQREDLFVYEVQHVSLKKGQRMVVPINEVAIPYKDVYTLDIPYTPPPEVRGYFMEYSRQQSGDLEAAKLMMSPKVMHKIRLTNSSKVPLTTAPALIVQGDKVLAQGMMTYTSVGGNVDLAVTTAVDVNVEKKDKETSRTPNAVKWENNSYARIDLEGALKLTNRRDKPVEVEVARYVLGNVGEAGQDGKIEMVNVLEDSSFLPSGAGGDAYWSWQRWYNWPSWWYHFNGVGKISWKLTIEPTKAVDLTYTWNYYWR